MLVCPQIYMASESSVMSTNTDLPVNNSVGILIKGAAGKTLTVAE